MHHSKPSGNQKLDVSVLEFGARGDGVADDTDAIQTALNSGASRVTIPPGVFLISNVLQPAPAQCLVINGQLRIADTVIQPLAADVRIGDREVRIPDTAGFRIGQWVTLHDNRLPIQGGGRKTRRQSAGNARITAISDNTLTLDRAAARDYLRAAEGVVARQHGAVWIRHSGVHVSGCGAIDGNKAHQLDTAPGFLEREHGEDWRAASGVVVQGDAVLTDITIEGITVRDTTLMGICMMAVERGIIRNTTCLRAHDKNITLHHCRDCQIMGNTASDSEWEDGIMLHQRPDPSDASCRIMVQNNICRNNSRFGIHVGANIQRVHLSGNLCVENGLNLSIYGDDCTSTGDVAVDTTDLLFQPAVYRPNVLVAGKRASIVNLTALGTRFVALELSGSGHSVIGGNIGQMDASLPPAPPRGLDVAAGEWGGGSGEFHVKGDCRVGIAIMPELCGPRVRMVPDNIMVQNTRVTGCRNGLLVCGEARRLRLVGNDFSANDMATMIAPQACAEITMEGI